MANELTAEQTKILDAICDEYMEVSLSTEDVDREKAEEGAALAYRAAGLAPQGVIWYPDPVAAELASIKRGVPKMTSIICAQHDVVPLVTVKFETIIKPGGSDQYPDFRGAELMARNGFWFWALNDAVLACERPYTLKLNGDPKEQTTSLHCIDGPSVAWESGLAMYHIHGVRVTKEIVTGKFSAKAITSQANAEVRRVMLSKYGQSKYLVDIGAKPFQQDLAGTMYRADMGGDEPLVMVRYINRSPEAGLVKCRDCGQPGKESVTFSARLGGVDSLTGTVCACGSHVVVKSGRPGVYKTYWHRVPPGTPTAELAFDWMQASKKQRKDLSWDDKVRETLDSLWSGVVAES